VDTEQISTGWKRSICISGQGEEEDRVDLDRLEEETE
jgi:hypothetical protein